MRTHLASVASRQDAFLLPDHLSDTSCPPCLDICLMIFQSLTAPSSLSQLPVILGAFVYSDMRIFLQNALFPSSFPQALVKGLMPNRHFFHSHLEMTKSEGVKPQTWPKARVSTQKPRQKLPQAAQLRETVHTKKASVLAGGERGPVHSFTALLQHESFLRVEKGGKDQISDMALGSSAQRGLFEHLMNFSS